ncbi:hypothetical protein U1839_16860 [Sphingomonas sp. RT2P30]|uniref:hypothetical protein n=1 Tax=Parasphingomonas halimpatiens TaxID=3096162 RepID=UPI002FC74785
MLAGLFPVEVLQAFYGQMQSDIQSGGRSMQAFTAQGPLLRRPAIEIYAYQYPPMLAFLWGLTPRISLETGCDLLPTYAYFRLYQRDDICRVHADRAACEHSLSLTIAYAEDRPWPLSVATQRSETPQPISDDFGESPYETMAMRPGDGVLYKGVHHRHGRLNANPNSWSAHIFLHWVDRNGAFRDQAFDRPTIEAAKRAARRT